jgi:4-amino-4-deoxy-L-arabinose transferase-like glycosyltransferase
MVAILPINVWLSHFSKHDSAVSAAVLLIAWSLLRKLGNPDSKGSDVMVGVALAIAMSFKQTARFVAASALVGFVALLRWDCKLPWSRIARGLLVGLLACVVAWLPMNIGVLLDIPGFLDYQRATVVVMSRYGTAYQIAEHVIRLLVGNVTGLTAAGLLAWLFAPFIRRDVKLLILWGSVALAYVAFSAISGG